MILAMLVENSDSFKTMWNSTRFGKALTIRTRVMVSAKVMLGLWSRLELRVRVGVKVEVNARVTVRVKSGKG